MQGKPEDRPIMSSVVVMLGNNDAPLPNPKPLGFKAIDFAKVDPTQNPHDLYTFNNVTLTVQIGR